MSLFYQKNAVPDGSIPISQSVHPPTLGPFKVTYRPLLADIVKEADIKDLCKLLVGVSGEAAKAYAGIALAIMLVLPSEFYHFRMTKYPGEPAVLLACMSYLGDIQ